MKRNNACKRVSFIVKDNCSLVCSTFQYINWLSLFFSINIYHPFGTEASTVFHCLKSGMCQRTPYSSVRGAASGESAGCSNVFPKGVWQQQGALTQQLGINYIALQRGTKGTDISSRDSLQSYTVKLCLSRDFSFIYLFYIVNLFHIFVGFGRQCVTIKVMVLFSSIIERAFRRSSFVKKIVTTKIENLTIICQHRFHKKKSGYPNLCLFRSVS